MGQYRKILLPQPFAKRPRRGIFLHQWDSSNFEGYVDQKREMRFQATPRTFICHNWALLSLVRKKTETQSSARCIRNPNTRNPTLPCFFLRHDRQVLSRTRWAGRAAKLFRSVDVNEVHARSEISVRCTRLARVKMLKRRGNLFSK